MEAVVIVPYDPAWPEQFAKERERLLSALSGTSAVVEHVGSTAVPNLGAKPIIDIMVGVPALNEIEARIPAVESLGYEYVRQYEIEVPERRYFRRPRVGPRTHHLHCVVRGSDFWRRLLLFRDYLCSHRDVADAYHSLKQELAARYGMDRIAYAKAKTPFIESVIAKAVS